MEKYLILKEENLENDYLICYKGVIGFIKIVMIYNINNCYCSIKINNTNKVMLSEIVILTITLTYNWDTVYCKRFLRTIKGKHRDP